MSMLSQLPRQVARCMKTEYLARKSGFRILRGAGGNRKKAIILGSGASVLELRSWPNCLLNQFDKIAVNYSYLSGVPVDLLFFEPTNSSDLNGVFLEDMAHGRFLGQTMCAINLRHWREAPKRFPIAADMPGVVGFSPIAFQETDPEKFLTFYKRMRLSINFPRVIHHSTHVFAALDWAVMARYSEIVIFGVDLNGSAYFSEVNRADMEPFEEARLNAYNQARAHLEDSMGYSRTIHPSTDPVFANRYRQLRAEDLFRVLSQLPVFERCGVKIYTGTNASRLADWYPVYRIGG